MEKLLIIKLGGSVITYKDSLVPKARMSVIKRLSRELKEIYDQGYKIILVHGAGSFAHPIAKQHALKDGVFSKEQTLATSTIHYSMTKLNNLICEILISLGVPASGLPPHAFITQEEGNLLKIPLDLINRYLGLGIIPVLFGDMVLDNKINGSVISGDAIVPYLGNKLKAEKVVYISDVNGIFKENPKINPKSELIKVVNDSNYLQIVSFLSPHNKSDVTGEMAGKLKGMRENLINIPIYIISGNTKNNLRKIMNGEEAGTKIMFGRNSL